MNLVICRLCDAPQWAKSCEAWDMAQWPRTPDIAAFFDDHYAASAQNPNGMLPQAWVALDGGIPVGMMSLIADDHPDFIQKGPWLASAFVLPEYRGRGIFKNLHDHVVSFVHDKTDLKTIFVYSHLDFEKWEWKAERKTYDPFAPDKMVTIFRRDF